MTKTYYATSTSKTLSTIVKTGKQTFVIAGSPLKTTVQVADVGLSGPAGNSGGSYVHNQSSALATWTITHNLGYYPGGISVIDSAETVVIGDVTHVNISTFTVSFSSAFSGKVYVS